MQLNSAQLAAAYLVLTGSYSLVLGSNLNWFICTATRTHQLYKLNESRGIVRQTSGGLHRTSDGVRSDTVGIQSDS